MAKPQTLRTIEDYRPALLWLMGQLKRAQKWDALAEFERELGALIPPEHLQENSPIYYVSRARRALVKAGLMGSGGRGIWTITPAGQQWLAEHPDGGEEELKALVRLVKKRVEARSLKQAAAPVGVTLEQLKATKAAIPPDQFRQIWGGLYDQLLAQERARSKTTISDRQLGTRARAVLREVHDFLDGDSGAVSSEKAYDWMLFCYSLGLHRETVALSAYVFKDDLPEWAYERASKMAEACRARLG